MSCVPAPVVQAPVTIVVQPAPVASCFEERVLVEDALQAFAVDAGAEPVTSAATREPDPATEYP